MSKLLAADVDWLTCGGEKKTAREARDIVSGTRTSEDFKPAQWMGYDGYRLQGVFYGERDNRWLVKLGSEPAQELWRDLVPLATRCSRVDIQMTVGYDVLDWNVQRNLFLQAQKCAKLQERYPQHSFIDSGNGAETFYLGDRTSERFFRCYDKGLQAKIGARGEILRMELELKSEIALNVIRELLGRTDLPAAIGGYISSHLHERGLFPPMPPFVGLKLPREKKSDNSVQLKLEWLQKQVAPTVAALIDAGHSDYVAYALSLPGIVAADGSICEPKSWL